MRIGVIGAGAVGGAIAALLDRAGHDVVVTARGEHLATIQRDGITLDGAWGEHAFLQSRLDPEPYSAGTFVTDLAAGTTQVLPYVGAGVGGGIVLMFAFMGIRKGIQFFRGTAK